MCNNLIKMKPKSGATLGMCGSYNTNSKPQLLLIEATIPYIKEGIECLDIIPSSFPLIIADFGSSHGANSVYVIKKIIDFIKEIKKIEKRKNQKFYIYSLLSQKKYQCFKYKFPIHIVFCC